MAVRDHGYHGWAFIAARALQFVCLVPVIGMVSNFISLLLKAKQEAPQELVASLVIVRKSTPLDNIVYS